MPNKTMEKTKEFLNSYRRNFLSFLSVILSIVPVVVIAVCVISLAVYLLNQEKKYLVIFVGTLFCAPLMQTMSEFLEHFFEKHTRK